MQWLNILKDSISGLASAISSTVGGDIFERFYRYVNNCHPTRESDKECNARLRIDMVSINMILAWSDYFIQWIPLVSKNYFKIPSFWSALIDISKMWNFYLYAGLAIYIEIEGKDKEMNDAIEFFPFAIGTFILAALSNLRFRTMIRDYKYPPIGEHEIAERKNHDPQTDRGETAKIIDGIFGFFTGFANMRYSVAGIMISIDGLRHTIWRYTPTAALVRYLISAPWGAINSVVSATHSPHYATEDLFPPSIQEKIAHTIFIINGTLAPVVFTAIIGSGIHNMDLQSERIGFSTGFILLVPAILLRNWYKNKNSADNNDYAVLAGNDAPSPDDERKATPIKQDAKIDDREDIDRFSSESRSSNRGWGITVSSVTSYFIKTSKNTNSFWKAPCHEKKKLSNFPKMRAIL